MSVTAKRPATPEEFEALRSRLAGLSHEEKVGLATKTRTIAEHRVEVKDVAKRGKKKAPRTDDELWQWIVDNTGYKIPRAAVCDGHQAPFDFISDIYFERVAAALQIGSREFGKTLGVAILHAVNSETKPRCESITFGAIEQQAKRAYEHVKSFIFEEIEHEDGQVEKRLKPQIEETLRSETRWKTGSKVEIIVGTRSGVNSPHSQKVHADEVDLMERPVWDESRSISSSKLLPDGTRIMGQDIATSTRKSMHGIVQEIVNECEEAAKQGLEAPWKIYTCCIFEAAEEVPNCRTAPIEEREARLRELGEDPCSLCNCDKVAKGEWAEDLPRTMDTVCKGRFFRSRGWMPREDVVRKFRQNTPSVWTAQMECRRPMTDGLYLEAWSRERFSVVGWQPRPEYGQIWMGVDWGGSAESAIIWTQGPLRTPVKIQGPAGMVTVPAKAFVVFDELLEANIGAGKLADKVIAKEVVWRRKIPGFRVSARFPDVAGKQQRDDWREHNPPLQTFWYLPNRDFDPQVSVLQDLVADKFYWVDSHCSRHMDDIESWRQKDGREVHDPSSHSMAASRYLHSNVMTVERRKTHTHRSKNELPVVVGRPVDSSLGAVVSGGGSDPFSDERAWRSKLGDNFPDRPFGR